ncbi:MAG: hypothetical protein H8E36_10625 [Rhodospirillaceae bacterium]|nr:hypothetical protein [Rhodospirillaceae bacterium]MBL6930321.1 hypothetical protein [Rhodospirillales bacterium]
MRIFSFLLIALAILVSAPVAVEAKGNMAKKVYRLEPLILGDGEENDFAVSRKEVKLETGKYYVLPVTAKGFKEYRLEAPDFFQNIWVSQVVVEDLEVHTTKIHAMEFDDQGTMDLWFIAIKPGTYKWAIEDFEEKGMTGTFVVE